MKLNTILTGVLVMLLTAFYIGCSDDQSSPVQQGGKQDSGINRDHDGMQTEAYQSGTHDGFFWSLWTSDGLTGSVNYSNGSGGNYSVSWNCNGNFTTGKGWSTGSTSRIVGYNCGAYSQSGGGGSFAYYGWSRNPLREYYVNEKWPGTRPTGTSMGTINSDGGTYNLYRAQRVNAPSIDGTQTFWQIFSTRTAQAPTGSNQTITFANHATAWANAGWGLGSDLSPAAILLTEAWGQSSGYSNATVWSAGSSGSSSSSSSSGGSSSGGSSSGGFTGLKQVRNVATGLYLDGMGRTTNGSAAGQYANTTHVNAHWNITSAGSGYYYLTNQGTNMKLDGYGRTVNGEACAQYSNVTTHVNAQWSIVAVGSAYYLINRGTNMRLDGMGRTNNGADVGQWANTTSQNAQWQIVN